MSQLLLRTALIILHAVANFIAVSYLMEYDISGHWFFFVSFITISLLLLFLFIRHLLNYIYFIKTKTK